MKTSPLTQPILVGGRPHTVELIQRYCSMALLPFFVFVRYPGNYW